MPLVENSDGTLWIDINEMSEVDAVRTELQQLGVRVTALVRDPDAGVIVKEVEWSDAYPRIVPRNGPKPGIVVNPGEIPDDRTLVLEACMLSGPGRDPETVIVLRLIEGPVPGGVSEVIGRPWPPPTPGLRRPKPPPGV
jgi:hypothetical protein